MGRRWRVQVDARTKTMSAAAKTCRGWGHSMVLVTTPARERREYAARGQRLAMLKCERQCTYWRNVVLWIENGKTVSAKSGYGNPAEYLVQERGTGRLPRSAARVAFFEDEG